VDIYLLPRTVVRKYKTVQPYFPMLYAFFWVIPRGITQKKAYNIQNMAKV
jgi:hypothetical protein